MTIEQWVAVGALAMTIFSSAITIVLFFNRANTAVLAEVHSLRIDLINAQKDWHTDLLALREQFHTEVNAGPPWLKLVLDKNESLLTVLSESATLALNTAQANGQQITEIKERIRHVEDNGKEILSLIASKAG